MTIRYDEKGKYFTEFITKETVPILVQTSHHRIHGQIHIQPKERLKDALNHSKPFLALTEVTICDLDEIVQFQAEFLALNKDQIQWVIPVEDLIASIPGVEGD